MNDANDANDPMQPQRHAQRVPAPSTVGAVCNRCGRIQRLTDLCADYPLYEQLRAARPDALAVPLVCVDRHGCQRRQKAKGLL